MGGQGLKGGYLSLLMSDQTEEAVLVSSVSFGMERPR